MGNPVSSSNAISKNRPRETPGFPVSTTSVLDNCLNTPIINLFFKKNLNYLIVFVFMLLVRSDTFLLGQKLLVETPLVKPVYPHKTLAQRMKLSKALV